jgi:5-methylcytosine-specific restriction enzyme A
VVGDSPVNHDKPAAYLIIKAHGTHILCALMAAAQRRQYMSKGLLKQFYNSIAWQRARAAYIKYRQSIDGGMCEACHDELGTEVHHVIPLTEDNYKNPQISLSFENFKLVSKVCHNKEHNPDKETAGRARYDEYGNVT